MQTYVKRFTIDGKLTCEAASVEEAEAIFGKLSLAQIAEKGDLVTEEVRTEEQDRQEIEAVLRVL